MHFEFEFESEGREFFLSCRCVGCMAGFFGSCWVSLCSLDELIPQN